MKYIELVDVSGRVWVSDPDIDGEMTPEAVEAITPTLSNFGELTQLKLTINGVDHFFNPANVIVWAITDSGQFL